MTIKPNEQWEVAGGNKRPPTKTNGDAKKQQQSNGSKQDVLSKMPRQETLEPLKLQASQFDAFRDDSDDDSDHRAAASGKKQPTQTLTSTETSSAAKSPKKQQQSREPPVNLVAANVADNKASQKKKQPTSSSGNNSPRPTVNELDKAIGQLKLEDFQKEHTQLQSIFAQSPTLVLQNMAGFLNKQLSQVPESDASVNVQRTDYPLSKLDPKLEKYLGAMVAHTSAADLETFGTHCFNAVFDEQNKTSHGYKLFVQVLLKHGANRTHLFLAQREALLRTLQECKHRHQRCLSALWMLAQSGFSNLSTGLTLWFEVMLPLIINKQFTNFVAAYPQALLEVHKVRDAKTPTPPNIGLDYYSRFYELTHNDKTTMASLSKETSRKLHAAFDEVRRLYADELSRGAHVFEPLLSSLPAESGDKQKDLLDLAAKCLTTNKVAFSKWNETYAKHLPQSLVLMTHMSSQKVQTIKPMREAMTKFQELSERALAKVTPETAAAPAKKENQYARGKAGKAAASNAASEVSNMRKFNTLTKQVINKHYTKRSLYSTVLRWLMYASLVLAAFVAWDVNLNHSLYSSSIPAKCAEYGIKEQCEQVSHLGASMHDLRVRAVDAVKAHTPHWYKRADDTLLDKVRSSWHTAVDYATHGMLHTAPHRNMLMRKFDHFKHYLETHVPMLRKNHNWLVQTGIDVTHATGRFIAHKSNQLVDAVEGLFGWKKGEVQKKFAHSFKSFFQSLTRFVQWINSYLKD